MDIGLLRTFLEVQRTRHFGKASRNLFITQSAVSARIKLLEETLGVRLFSRVRDNIQLTKEGKHLLKPAETIVSLWEEARKGITLGGQEQALLVMGGTSSLWDIFLPNWLSLLRGHMPELAVRCETHGNDALVQALLGKTIDVGFMYDPPRTRELAICEVTPVELVLVASRPGILARDAVNDHYIMVDWGTSFAAQHARWFPELPPPMLHLDRGRMALDALLAYGGAAFLAKTMVEQPLQEGRLHLVPDAQSFQRTAFAVHPLKGECLPMVEAVLALFKEPAAPEGTPAPSPG